MALVEAFNDLPELTSLAIPYWDAFNTLNPKRPLAVGMVVVPLGIPLTEIKAYLDLLEINDLDDRARYVRLIDQLDAEYLSLCRRS
jgi:hypothetical protein